jgi:hypothetical protein
MPTKHDIKLIQLLDKASNKWGNKLDEFTGAASKAGAALFEDYEQNKRFLILSFLETLKLDENGFIVDGMDNREALAAMLKEMQGLNATQFSRGSQFGKWVDRNYSKAASMGVLKTQDIYKIGEGTKLPRGYRPPTKAMVRRASSSLYKFIADRNAADVSIVRSSVLRRIFDPTGSVKQLRSDLTRSGQLEGILDTIGRRITASERADRIARYEFPRIMTETHRNMVDDIYNDGKPNPKNTFYLWDQVQDERKSPSHRRRHGQILSEYQWLNKSWGDKQTGLAPCRPRCRCDTSVVRPEWFSPETRKKYFNAKETKPVGDELKKPRKKQK